MGAWDQNKRDWNIHVLMDQSGSVLPNSTPCVYGDDIKIIYKRLEEFCFKELSERDFDFIVLISSIDYADRCAKRRVVKLGWAREINLNVPVYDPEFWSSNKVNNALKSALEILTGDVWNIKFSLNKAPFSPPERPHLRLRQNVTYNIIPFSDGLDSFVFGQKLLSENEDVVQIRLTAKNHGVRENNNREFDRRVFELGVPVHSKRIDHSENSFRTRSVKFLGLAALAAHMVDAETISLPENGQGIHGPILMPKGHEYFYYGSHPAFTKKFSVFLKHVFGKAFRFEHPNLWKTKGQTLRDLQSIGSIAGWDKTTSCVRDARQSRHECACIQCGICINCMLRRVAVMSGGLGFRKEKYLWNDLNADSVAGSLLPDTKIKSTKNDDDIGKCAVIGLEELAGFSNSLGAEETMKRSSYLLEDSGIGTIDENLKNLNNLIQLHKAEWGEFLTVLPSSSWVKVTAELVR